jgi:DNA-binding MarR family transcriptional regulator
MTGQETDHYYDSIHKFLQLNHYVWVYSQAVRAVGISGRKVAALRRLMEEGAQTIGQLGTYLYINDSSASEMVSGLQELGYVRRTRSKQDSRVVLAELTEAGRELVEKAPLGGIGLLRKRLLELEPERLQVIHQALTDLVDILEIDPDT